MGWIKCQCDITYVSQRLTNMVTLKGICHLCKMVLAQFTACMKRSEMFWMCTLFAKPLLKNSCCASHPCSFDFKNEFIASYLIILDSEFLTFNFFFYLFSLSLVCFNLVGLVYLVVLMYFNISILLPSASISLTK